METGRSRTPAPRNEEVRDHAPGSPERIRIEAEIRSVLSSGIQIPALVGGEAAWSGDLVRLRVPHDHKADLGSFHRATSTTVRSAIDAALGARASWSRMPAEERAAIFLKAAELLAGRDRAWVDAVSMLSLSKTVHQAEIDAIAELADYFRFNVHFMRQILDVQPENSPGVWNRMDWRPLEGFVLAVTPFNFVSIAGNLPAAPALMGNTVVWKPASSAVYPAWAVLEVLREAGLPPGVINFVPCRPEVLDDVVLSHPDLAGIHFTGSTRTMQHVWSTVSRYVGQTGSFPRVVGETGGKGFVVAHPSADAAALATALVRGAFEFQGQKCSAASRAYIPRSLWPDLQARLRAQLDRVRMGDVADFRNFMGAVIDEASFGRIQEAIEGARRDPRCEIWIGGGCDDRQGWFVQPTVVVTEDPQHRLMNEEIFGPLLTVYVYPDDRFADTMILCDRTSPYALTGSVFARDRSAIALASEILRHAAGNFYVNDKPTGAVVGQQPFGGGRASGTNDKAGSLLNLLRWVSPRTVKENFDPPVDFAYPYLGERR